MSWADALDALEERLRRQEQALANGGEVTADQWTPAEGLVPEELVPRAVALLERSRALEAEVADMVAHARRSGAGRARTNAYGDAGPSSARL